MTAINTSQLHGPSRRTVGIRTGGRSERVVAAVFDAVLAELARVGYNEMRLEDVAARAGVAKTTLYRRWPTKADLVLEAVRGHKTLSEPLPDTGSVRADVLAMLEATIKLVGTPVGKAMTRLITIERGDPEVERLCRKLKETSRAQRASLIERAQENGQLPKNVAGALIMDAIFSLIMSRIVRFNERVTRAECEQLIDLVITGAENGGGQQQQQQQQQQPRARAKR